MKCFCAFCRSERRVYGKRHITWMNGILALIASITAMVILWQQIDARVSILFVVFLFVAEVFVQFRWRTSLPCPHCGFDPIIYMRTPEIAAQKVRSHLQKRQEDPMVLLSSKAKLNLPVRRQSKLTRDPENPAP